MQTGSRGGMLKMEQSLADLVLKRVVTPEEAIARSSRRIELTELLSRLGAPLPHQTTAPAIAAGGMRLEARGDDRALPDLEEGKHAGHAQADGTYRVEIKMSMTAPGCGMGDVLKHDVRSRVQTVPGVSEVDVEVVWDPPWDQTRLSDAARLELGLY